MNATLFPIDHRAAYACPGCRNRVTINVEHHEAPRCHNNHPSSDHDACQMGAECACPCHRKRP